MNVLFLLPPSEGKKSGGEYGEQKLSYRFDKPFEIATNTTEKDLKCTGKRYLEGVELNNNIFKSNELQVLPVIERYSGVMYNAIDYANMSDKAKQFFERNFKILSGMYGILSPQDMIADYKLPVETKGLYQFWGAKITEKINELSPEYVVNLLPGAYWKMIDVKNIDSKIIHVNFLTYKEGKRVKISHGVKKIKGAWVHNICEKSILDYRQFGGEIVEHGNNVDINFIY